MRPCPRLAAAVVSLVLTLALAAPVFAQLEGTDEGQVLRNAQMVKQLMGSRAQRLGTSAGPDPDTVTSPCWRSPHHADCVPLIGLHSTPRLGPLAGLPGSPCQ